MSILFSCMLFFAAVCAAALGLLPVAAVCVGLLPIIGVIRYMRLTHKSNSVLADAFQAMTGLHLSDAPMGLVVGLGPVIGLQAVLVLVKVMGWSAQPWWWIALPTWAYLGLVAGTVLLVVIIAKSERHV